MPSVYATPLGYLLQTGMDFIIALNRPAFWKLALAPAGAGDIVGEV